jgi:F-type H+-transporting ATPase subunit delta
MSKESVAKRYAVALFNLAQEENALEQIKQELRVVYEVFTTNDELSNLLKQPKITAKKKREIIKEAFGSTSQYVINTLLLLVDRHRENIIPTMVEEFLAQANELQGVADATVYSVRELTDKEKKALSDKFAKELGKKKINIENVIEPSILGGVMLRVGNRIYDGSVQGKLERVEKQLVSSRA